MKVIQGGQNTNVGTIADIWGRCGCCRLLLPRYVPSMCSTMLTVRQ